MKTHLILVAAFVFIGACTSPETTEPVRDPSTFDNDWNAFTAAYDEMRTAIHATPTWSTRADASADVRGQAEFALRRLDVVAEHVGGPRISNGVVQLAAEHVRQTAKIDNEARPSVVTDEKFDRDDARRIWNREDAFLRFSTNREWLEEYVAGGVRNGWLENHVMSPYVESARLVTVIPFSETKLWVGSSPNYDDYIEAIAAAADFLDGHGAMK